MAQRSNHYEAAFEEYLRQTRIPHVAVDERRRSLLQDVSLKSLDYIVYSRRPRNLLVDVKLVFYSYKKVLIVSRWRAMRDPGEVPDSWCHRSKLAFTIGRS